MIIVSIVIVLIGVALVAFVESREEGAGVLGMLGGMFIALGIACVGASLSKSPTALDVYRNKTTLKITYEDSIPVDTVVVFKDKYARN